MEVDVESSTIWVTVVIIISLYIVQLFALFLHTKILQGNVQKLLVIKDASDSFNAPYLVTVVTGTRWGSGTRGVVKLTLGNKLGEMAEFLLNPVVYDLQKRYFRCGAENQFLLMTHNCLGDLFTLDLQLVSAEVAESWYVSYILVECITTGELTYFPCHEWIKCKTEHSAARVILIAGYNHSVSAKIRFFLDMFLWSLRKYHMWFKSLTVFSPSVFNNIIHMTYRTCLFASLLLSTVLVFIKSKGVLIEDFKRSLLYCIPPALLLSLKMCALERALYYFEHRSRFEKWMLSGRLSREKNLRDNIGRDLSRVMDDLSSSIWEPYCNEGHGDVTSSGSHGFLPSEPPLPIDDDSDWSPEIPSFTQPLSHWLTSTPGQFSGEQQPRQMALATDSDYAIYAHENHVTYANVDHSTPISNTPARKDNNANMTSPRDTVPLRLFNNDPNYQATLSHKRNTTNGTMIEHNVVQVSPLNVTKPRTADDILKEVVSPKNITKLNNSSLDSKLYACYDNEAFDPNESSVDADEQRFDKNQNCSSQVAGEKPTGLDEISVESWVLVEKPMELILKDAVSPTLSDILAENQDLEEVTSETLEDAFPSYSEFTTVVVTNRLVPVLDEVLAVAQDSITHGESVEHSKRLDEIKGQISELLSTIKSQKSQDDHARIKGNQSTGERNTDEGFGKKLSTACQSDSVLEQKHESVSSGRFESFRSSKSQSLVKQKRSRPSIEDIQDELQLGAVAAKISSLLIDYSLSSKSLENRLSSKCQHERQQMLDSLRSIVGGEKSFVGEIQKRDHMEEENQSGTNQDFGPIVTNPIEVMGRLSAKFTGKINDTTMTQIASASLQSILSDETRARFDDIVANQCRNEAMSFAEDIVNSLYDIVKAKLEAFLQAEMEKCNSGELQSHENQSPSNSNGGKSPSIKQKLFKRKKSITEQSKVKEKVQCFEELLEKAQKDVRAHVLPVIREHLVSMLEKQARTLDTLDVDLMMLLYGGQYVDTIVTNAVLQTHVGLAKCSKKVSSTKTNNSNVNCNSAEREKADTVAFNRNLSNNLTEEYNSGEPARPITTGWSSVIKIKSSDSVSPSNCNQEAIAVDMSNNNKMGDYDTLMVESFHNGKHHDSDYCPPPVYQDHAYCKVERIASDVNNNNMHNESLPASDFEHQASYVASMTLPEHYDVTTVTSRVLEAVHAKLRETGSEALSGLMGSEIHCRLCRPKAIREIKRKVASMAAGRHLTLQVYQAALEEIHKLAGLQDVSDITAQNTSNLLETDLLKRVGELILRDEHEREEERKKGSDDVNRSQMVFGGGGGISRKLYCQETIEKIGGEILKVIMDRAYEQAAENLIATLRLSHDAEHYQSLDQRDDHVTSDSLQYHVTSSPRQQHMDDMLHDTQQHVKYNEASLSAQKPGRIDKGMRRKETNVREFLSEPLREEDTQQLSHEYEQIRSMLFASNEEKEEKKKQVHFDFTNVHSLTPCTYYRHYFTVREKYRLSKHVAFMYFLLVILTLLTVGSLVGSIIFGVQLDPYKSMCCLIAFLAIILGHALFFEPVKVLILTIIAVFCYRRVP